MTIAQSIKESIIGNDGEFIAKSSVWGIHVCKSIGGKGSNVRKVVLDAFKNNSKIIEIWVKCGAKGRSQHDKTEVFVFDVSNMSKEQRYDADIDYSGKLFNRKEFLHGM